MGHREVISLLATEERVDALLVWLSEELQAQIGREALMNAELLRSALFGSELVIALSWGDEAPLLKSRFGLSLAERLREEGMVNHTLWKPCFFVADACSEVDGVDP